jgi:hypothetical protein
MATVPGRKAKKQRVFFITFSIDGTDYKVLPLPIDPSIGTKAVRFCKQGGDGEVYDLHLDAFGWNCQCRGFLRHGHCKHVSTVQKAGPIFAATAAPAAEPADWSGVEAEFA